MTIGIRSVDFRKSTSGSLRRPYNHRYQRGCPEIKPETVQDSIHRRFIYVDESLAVTCRFSVCHSLDAIIKMAVKSAVRHGILVARVNPGYYDTDIP